MPKKSDTSTLARPRRKQMRAIETHERLVDAGIALFSIGGFDGTTIRQLEQKADVQRGLLAYHFGDKESLWRAVADRLFGGMKDEIEQHARILSDVSPREAARALMRAIVRYSAKHPELNRLVMQESVAPSWRVDYFVNHHIKAMSATINHLIDPDGKRQNPALDAHIYYIMVGGGAFVFSVEYECEALFGINPREPAFVERHADILSDMIFGPSEKT